MKNDKSLEDHLNQNLCNDYFVSFQNREVRDIYHPRLLEYLNCSTIVVKNEKNEVQITTDQVITPRLIMGLLNLDIENIHFPEFLKLVKKITIWILDEESDKKLYQSFLIDWFYGESKYNNKNYIKFENEWFHYSIRFGDDLNNRLDDVSNRISIEKMDKWTSDFSKEGCYNDEYSKKSNFIVGDRIFHKNIEVADLISWNDNELIVYHVKSGLDKDLRILQSQIVNSVKIISEFRSNTNSDDVQLYYNRLKQNAGKLNYQIPEYRLFREILKKKTVRFVFAFATCSNNSSMKEIIDEIKSTQSLIAKIAVLHTFYTVKQHQYEFSISKIIRE